MMKPKAKISEVFSSIQGEGLWIGWRQIFVRFWGCNLRCSFCDESWKPISRRASLDDLMGDIERLNHREGSRWVSLTGGEPLVQVEFLKEFLPWLQSESFEVYLETNGTLPHQLEQVIDSVDVVAMDMKLPSSTRLRDFWKEHKEFIAVAKRRSVFVKAVITSQTIEEDIERMVEIMREEEPAIPLVLQPATPNESIQGNVALSKLLHFQSSIGDRLKDVRVIPQVHKLMGVR